ncbi:MAG: hypothetical protein V1655_02155 [bacterium]
MLKKEIIWRHILYEAIEKNIFLFQQKELAEKFNFSLSTVFNALKIPREIKAVEISGRGFKLKNTEKLLYLWGTQRKLEKDIIYKTFVNEPIEKIEGMMPDDIIWGGFSAYKYKFGAVPSDYGKIYVYSENKEKIEKRFPLLKGVANLFIIKSDAYLKEYGTIAPIAQIFVDIWNTSDWYGKEFLDKLKEKMLII